MGRCVGLDVHKTVVQAALIDVKGRLVQQSRFGCSRGELEQFARRQLRRTDRVALEATTNTWAVVDVLTPFVKEVVVSNPLLTKAIASAKVKTDKVDALVLAQLLRCDYLPRVWEPPPDVRCARSITGRRAALIADRTTIKNRIQSALHQRLIASPGRRLFEPRGREWLAKVAIDDAGRSAIDSDLRLIDAIDQELEVVDTSLLRSSAESEDAKLLVTLPGVNVSTAQTVLAAVGDFHRFADPDRAASYLGLVPCTRESADHCAHGPITKRGNSRARWMLVEAARAVASHPGPLGAFFRRLAKKRGRNIALVATARKLIVIAWYMITRREPYRYAQPSTTESKLRRIRTAGGEDRRKRPRPRVASKTDKHSKAGVRRIPALKQVYQSEGLPATQPLADGEKRMLRQKRLTATVKTMCEERWLPAHVSVRDGLVRGKI